MTLATRVIPVLLHRGRQLVKGKQFNAWRSVGVVTQAVRVHQSRGVDELIVLDIGATPEGRAPDTALIHEMASDCFMPLTVGGGITTVDQAAEILRNGADKVCLGTAAAQRPMLIEAIAKRFGSQAVVVAIDAWHTDTINREERYIAIRCGKQGLFSEHPVGFAKRCAELGAGEIVLTSINREGTMNGYDLELIGSVADATDIPVIANGGCGTYQHLSDALRSGAHAVAAGAMFQFTDATPRGASEWLKAQGWHTRVAA